jgi:hypothetical protein
MLVDYIGHQHVVHANVGHNVTLLNDGRTAVSYHFSTYKRCDNQPQHKKNRQNTARHDRTCGRPVHGVERGRG